MPPHSFEIRPLISPKDTGGYESSSVYAHCRPTKRVFVKFEAEETSHFCDAENPPENHTGDSLIESPRE